MNIDKETYQEIFSYPSQEEIIKITESFPILKGLHFKWIEPREEYFTDLESIQAICDALAWHKRIENKLTKLEFSFIQAQYQLSKGLPDDNWFNASYYKKKSNPYFPDFEEKHYYLKHLFGFFCESFYYHYSSVLDILAHILTVHLNLGVKKRLYFDDKLIERVNSKNSELAKDLKEFFGNNKSHNTIRNDFAHNYAINEIDSRALVEDKDGRQTVNISAVTYTPSKEIIKDMEAAVNLLVPLLRKVEQGLS